MTPNVGNFDRFVRIAIGLGLVAWALGLIPGVEGSVWGWIGIIPLATAFFGFCPLYRIIGVSTCATRT